MEIVEKIIICAALTLVSSLCQLQSWHRNSGRPRQWPRVEWNYHWLGWETVLGIRVFTTLIIHHKSLAYQSICCQLEYCLSTLRLINFFVLMRCSVYIFRRHKRSDWRFCACAINVKSLMCSERTKHLWYKYYEMFFRMYITSQQNYLSQINSRQTSFEACFDSKRKSRGCSAP